jgi:hypothetical protein
MKSGGFWRQTTLVECPKDFQMSVGTIWMSVGNFWTNIGNLDEVSSTDRKWNNRKCQSLVETYSGDTAKDIV